MNILLDTHAFLGAATEPKMLAAQVKMEGLPLASNDRALKLFGVKLIC